MIREILVWHFNPKVKVRTSNGGNRCVYGDFKRTCLQGLVLSPVLSLVSAQTPGDPFPTCIPMPAPTSSSHTLQAPNLARWVKPAPVAQLSQPCTCCLRYKWLVWWFSYNNLMVLMLISEVVELGFGSSFSQGIFKSTCPFPGCRQPLSPSYWSCAMVQRRICRPGEEKQVGAWLLPT